MTGGKAPRTVPAGPPGVSRALGTVDASPPRWTASERRRGPRRNRPRRQDRRVARSSRDATAAGGAVGAQRNWECAGARRSTRRRYWFRLLRASVDWSHTLLTEPEPERTRGRNSARSEYVYSASRTSGSVYTPVLSEHCRIRRFRGQQESVLTAIRPRSCSAHARRAVAWALRYIGSLR